MPAAALVAGGLSAGGQILGGFQQQAESKNEATMQEQQGQIAATNAQGEIAANDVAARRAIGGLNTSAGASGVTSGSGSVRAARSMDESMAILRDTYARYKGQTAEQNAYYQARATRYQGNQAMWGGLIGGAESAVGSAAMANAMAKGGGGTPGSTWMTKWFSS